MKTPIAAGTDIAGRNTPNIWPRYAQAVHCSELSICHSASQMPKETAKYATHHLNAVGCFQRNTKNSTYRAACPVTSPTRTLSFHVQTRSGRRHLNIRQKARPHRNTM